MLLDFVFLLIFLSLVSLAFYRGFIKEFFSLLGIVISISITWLFYNKLSDKMLVYLKNEIASDIISAIVIYLVINIIIMLINSKIFTSLSSMIGSTLDRFSGMLIGIFKSLFISFMLFSIIHVVAMIYCLPPTEELKDDIIIKDEEYMPQWIMHSVSYTIYTYIKKSFDVNVAAKLYGNMSYTVRG